MRVADHSSKLVMRVRFPSSALIILAQVRAILCFFSRHFYEVCSGRRARCVPDRFGAVLGLLALAFLASAKVLPMPAAIFRSLAGGAQVDSTGAAAPGP
jgi:hypothetical protein